LRAIRRNGVKLPKQVRICFCLAKHLKPVLGTGENHGNLKRAFGEGVDNYGIVHSTKLKKDLHGIGSLGFDQHQVFINFGQIYFKKLKSIRYQ
jgi:hypothetical protein